MFTVAKLRKKPRHFQSFTGQAPPQFDQLLNALRLAHEDHQRASGAGHKFTFALPKRLLMGRRGCW